MGIKPLSFIYLEKARQSFFSQTVEAKNMADFWRIWRHLTPFLWQRLKVVTASQAQFWARGSFRTPLVFIRWYFDFCSKFSYLSMGMIFYGFYLDFYDLIKDVQVIQDILGLGKEQRPDKTLKIWSTAIFSEVTADRESEQNISRFVWNRYLKVLEFLSFKLNILCSILFHVKFVRLTTKYTLPAYTEYSVYYTIWMRKLESKNLPFGILFYLLNWRPHISVKFVLSFRHTVAQFVKLTTCKLLIVQAHRKCMPFSHLYKKHLTLMCGSYTWPYFSRKKSQGQNFLIKLSADSNFNRI